MTDRRLWPHPQPIIVDNRHHLRATQHYLHRLGTLHATNTPCPRLLVRPTPGGGDELTLGLDILAALGKNPEGLRHDKIGGTGWELTRAWLTATGITDLLIDRAHTLPSDRIADLITLSDELGIWLWLIWSGDEHLVPAMKLIVEAGHPDQVIRPQDLPDVLPLPRVARPEHREPWPALPAADFTTFRAACRRHLSPRAFARADEHYRAAVGRVHVWMADHDPRLDDWLALPSPPLTDVATDLTGWLRDTHLGPATEPALALIVLRATQAALFRHAIFLRWNPATLGPAPAARLPGDLTPARARDLAALAPTDHVAATALSLHLNLPPTHFGCFRHGDLAADASLLTAPPPHSHPPPPQAKLFYAPNGALTPLSVAEGELACCQGPILIPPHARHLLAAHQALRRHQNADADEPLFLNDHDPARTPATVLLQRTIRTCDRLNLNPPWLHRGPCKYGADVGLAPRSYGWLHERALVLRQLDRDLIARLTFPPVGRPA
ncbi:hypothetical protein [Streptosporangium sp. NPDC000396]|uniref:hypothetical protein n=1 Tax=Streptosporangium sp. NPDC000396 TaxID=3366185 RepID=UPI0036A6F06A